MLRLVKKTVFICLLLPLAAHAEWLPAKSNRLVNDYSHILTDEQLSTLEQRLVTFNDSTSNQIVIVITPTLHGDEAINLATRIGHEWGVGQKELSNGLVILIKSKTQEEPSGDVAIATGYGVEGALPDAFCKRIIDDQMIDPLSEGEYYNALVKALDIIEPVLRGEYSYAEYKKNERTSALIGLLVVLGFVGVPVVATYIYNKKHPNNNNGNHGGNRNHTSGSYPWFMGSGHSGRSSGWGGGGFGGFGGGGFGGGGASGKF